MNTPHAAPSVLDLSPSYDYSLALLSEEQQRAIPEPEPVLNRKAGRVVPVCAPDIGSLEARYLAEAFASTWISSKGAYLQEFETKFSNWVGATYGCAVNSGTSALYLCMAALGVRPHDTVIVPTFTMAATANAPTYCGARAILRDSDDAYCLDPQGLAGFLSAHPDTKAVIPVHIYGQPCQIDEIDSICAKAGVPVIYDSAEAHGTRYRGRPLGEFGMANCYSFFGNKTLTTGEGGMIVSNDQGFIDVCRSLRDMAFSKDRHFWHRRLGFNFRMTNLQAAIGVAQCERADSLVQARRENLAHYREGLADVPGISFQPDRLGGETSAWMCGIEIDEKQYGVNRCALRKLLAADGVETRTYFVPIHLQPYYRATCNWMHRSYPRAEALSARGLYLPSSSKLTKRERKYVIDAIKRHCRD